MEVKRMLWFKVTAVFFAALMVIQTLPLTVFAKDTVQKQAIESTETPIDSDNSDIVIDAEIESMRTENSKTFLTADNGYYQITSALPLHNNIDGEWIDKAGENDIEINTVSDIEEYVDEQIEASLSSEDESTEPTKTITSNGDTYVDNCQTQIGTYSSTGSTDLSVIYARTGKNKTIRSEIYVMPYFPTDHAIFVTSATIKGDVSIQNIDGYNIIEEKGIYENWSGYSQPQRLNQETSTSYDIVEVYREDDDSVSKTYKFDITNYSRIGLINNYGVALTAGNENTNVKFENLTVEMYYHEIEDVDDNFEYEQIDLGRAGKLYINDYTCSPVIVRDELGLNGEIAPVSIQTIINPMDSISDIGFGKHTRINYYSTLVYDANSHIYLWKTCEGENLYLNYTTSNFADYKFSGNLSTDSTGNYIYDNITITNNSNHKKYKFTTYNGIGYLTEITDGSENDNSIFIEYSNIGDLHIITKITDGYGRQYILTYLNNHLSKISVKNSDDEPIYMNSEDTEHPLEITYSYNNNLLSSVTYADNKVINYVYGSDEKFTEIQNIDNSKITFAYESLFDGESYKLGNYKTFSSTGNINSNITITSISDSIYCRKFTKSDNSTKELTFDHNFNMIRLKNYNNMEYFLNYSNNELQYILTSDTVAENLVKNGTFHEVSNGQPTQWSYDVTDNSEIGQNIIPLNDDNSNRTLHMDNYMDTCRAYQIVEKSGYTFKNGKSYVLSGFVYRNDNPIAISDTRDLCIYVYDTKIENGAVVPDNCLTKMDFDDTLGEEWQQRKTIFTAQKDSSSLIVYLSYNNMMYTCDFDNIEIYEATVKNAIDAKGIIPSTDVEYDYSENNSILEEIKTTVDGDELGALYNYTDSENYISRITNNGVPTYYNYDNDNGLLLSKGNNNDTSKNAQFSYSPVGLLDSVKQAVTLIDTTSTVNINTNYTYENDRIKTVEHNNCIYEYEYDANGRVTGINEYPMSTPSGNTEPENGSEEPNNTSINKNNIVSYQYTNNEIGTISYGNGAKILYEYNQLGYITKITFVPAPKKSSDENGEQADTEENTEQTVTPIVYEYTYDDYGNVTSYTDHSNDTVLTIENDVYTIKEAGENGKILYQKGGNNRIVFGNKTTTVNPKLTTSSGKTTDSKVFNLYLPGKLLPANTVSASTVYDSVGRTFETIATDKTATVKNESTYITKGITTSNLVHTYISSVTRLKDATEPRIYRKLTYSYNDRGQITDIYRAAVNIIPENIENTSTSVNKLKNEILKHYEYDEAGQVILDVNMDSFKAVKYKYNEGGNLVSKTIYQNEDANDKSAFYYKKSTGKYIFNDSKAITKSYEYASDWSDVLTKYNGNTIEYDKIGNPTQYVGEDVIGNDVSGTMTWDGTRLTSFDDGNHKYIYKYSADGFRTQKTMYKSNSDTIVTQMDYVYENDNLAGIRTRTYDPKGPEDEVQPLTHEVVTNIISNSTNEAVGLDIQITAFNQEVEKNGVITFEDVTQKAYFYILRDGQGNITDMYNSTEDIVLHFSYDAYGNCDLTFSGNLLHDILTQLQGSSGWRKVFQAIVYTLVLGLVVGGTMGTTQQTYKGYVCDYETGLYYSQNRFYSPSWGRFINADDPNMLAKNQGEVFGANLFNYCNNDPVNSVDLSGYAPTSYDTSANILSALNIDQLNTIQVGVVPSKLHGKVKNEMTIFGLSLATVKNEDDKKYWNRVFGTTENIVQKTNGNNYMDTVLSKQSGAATMYDLKPSTSPYKIGE